jgi:myo-inositol-1(or 4)-monophosphatase
MVANERLELLSRLISDATVMATGWYQNRHMLAVSEKEGKQYVSAADLAIEGAIRELIHASFPDDAILGEEGGGELSGVTWVIDPIDGTSNFLNGLPLWGVSIGVMLDREPVLGAIALPVLGLQLVGGPRHQVSGLKGVGSVPPPIPTMAVGWNAGLSEEEERRQITAIRAAGFETVGYRCASASLYFAITGSLSGYYEKGLKLWDLAAAIALCAGAGVPSAVDWPDGDEPFVLKVGAAVSVPGL